MRPKSRDEAAAGSTSLRRLTQFPVDMLQIDRSLIPEMQADRIASSILKLIIALARKMEMKAIAEGIETGRQLDRLLEFGCE